MLLLQTEFLVGGINLIVNFRGYFLSHSESMPAQANTFPCHRTDWSSFPLTCAAVSSGRCEEARNREKFDVCWKSWQGWSKSPFTTNLCFFGRFLLINISLIPKLDASIRGLMSMDRQSSRKQICSPQRGTKSASGGWLHTARLAALQDSPGVLGWRQTVAISAIKTRDSLQNLGWLGVKCKGVKSPLLLQTGRHEKR